MRYVAQAAKAIFASAVAGLGALAAVLVGDADFSAVTAGQWVAIVTAALFVVINLTVDLLYAFIDPRIRYE